MSELAIIWQGLRNDREREIYAEGFWKGYYAGKKLKYEMREIQKGLRLDERAKTAIQQPSGQI